ncbi:hypothetical protein [Tautonia sociabilis]|uniref:PEP-CTERM sorting domain-containing protein n=1 Tax=Tautonia sociabilis TaxID=2080755 RepID=A0A432MEE9_9BACT|nr:hypothetical protein [Tautonia sociabilis]RUL83775.1 hypothetical protein TsocGM_21555 [Tautonia sociabilis]
MRQRNCPNLLAVGIGLLLATRAASAGAIQLTGDVEADFPLVQGNGVVAIVDNPNANGLASPMDVAQNAVLPGTTGWNIKDLRLSYDSASDRMYFGVNFFGIAGDADGDGDPGALSVGMGKDLPSLGGLESIAVGLDLDLDGTPDVVAGVPANKSGTGPGVASFTVAEYQRSPSGLAFSFGDSLTDHLGALAFDPSAEHPDFEFTIDRFSTLPGLDMKEGFIVSAFAGAPDDMIAGEDTLAAVRIAGDDLSGQNVPEPAAVLAWALVAGAAIAHRVRGRHRRGR